MRKALQWSNWETLLQQSALERLLGRVRLAMGGIS
jgi:hypothetical protein